MTQTQKTSLSEELEKENVTFCRRDSFEDNFISYSKTYKEGKFKVKWLFQLEWDDKTKSYYIKDYVMTIIEKGKGEIEIIFTPNHQSDSITRIVEHVKEVLKIYPKSENLEKIFQGDTWPIFKGAT